MGPNPQIEDYTVGWICALPIERAAAEQMLDEELKTYGIFTLGRIAGHNVAIASLPAGQIGLTSAATLASQMQSAFPFIRIGLMVGIGGGVPSGEADIRLGDVIISQPSGQHGGVVQYDLGKAESGGRLTRTGSLNMPPAVLLGALGMLRTHQYRGKTNPFRHLSALGDLANFASPEKTTDILFRADYHHSGGPTCDGCDKDYIVNRAPRSREGMIHYGTIASGNQVIKDGVTRERLSSELGGVLCFEMEAAGLMNSFPCLVIRGVCDYADSHKNNSWQPYAAATAAACAKEILSVLPTSEISDIRIVDGTIKGLLGQMEPTPYRMVTAIKELIHNGVDIAYDDFQWNNVFLRSVRIGHVVAVKLLLEMGAEIATRDPDGLPVLLLASKNGHEAVVRYLLESGADISATLNKDGSTALHVAVDNGHSAVVKLLLEMGANVSAIDHDGSTALLRAASNGQERIVTLLLENRADVSIMNRSGTTALSQAARNGHEAIVRHLLEKEADVASKEEMALPWAAQKGHVAVVKLLLEKGAKPSTKNEDGSTALHLATSNGYEATVKALLENGADTSARQTKTTFTALHLAVSNGHDAIVKLLLRAGADMSIPEDDSGGVALHLAAAKGHNEIVKLLLENGADIWVRQGRKGSTPLHLAAAEGHEAVVRVLLEKEGASHAAPRVEVNLFRKKRTYISQKDETGKTALHLAASGGHKPTLRLLLLEEGVDASWKDNVGDTALHLAAEAGHEKTVELLLQYKADVSAKNKKGKYVVDVASTTDVKNLLRKHGARDYWNRGINRVF